MQRRFAGNSRHSKQVAERLNRISAKRQEIIRPIFEHPRSFVLSNVRSMAERLGTDPATVVRIVRGLGFPGFREFQHYLHELSLAFATSADTMQSATPSAASRATSRIRSNSTSRICSPQEHARHETACGVREAFL